MKRFIPLVLGLAAVVGGVFFFVFSRQNHTPQIAAKAARLQVVTTNSILEDMVNNITKQRADVYAIVPRGVDPHEYEPRPEDITKATEADVMFHNGLNLETGGNGWFKKVVKSAHKAFSQDVFAASSGVRAKHLTTNVNEEDPHAWLDLNNGIAYVKTITRVLKQKDPANASFYQANSDRYVAKLEALHQKAQPQFADIPANQRLLVTSEGAFKYFAAAYHVTPAYIWEINTESQGTPEQMKAVLAKIAASDVQHLFVETSVSPKSMNKVAKATGLTIHAKIFTDSLAKKGTTGDTYYAMMKWNLDQIHEGLSQS